MDEFIADPADLCTPQGVQMDGWYKGAHFNVFASKRALREVTSTDLLLRWKPTVDPLTELANGVSTLDLHTQPLQASCDARMRVIHELTKAAQERLELIEELDRVAAGRLALIDRLHAECAPLRQGAMLATSA